MGCQCYGVLFSTVLRCMAGIALFSPRMHRWLQFCGMCAAERAISLTGWEQFRSVTVARLWWIVCTMGLFAMLGPAVAAAYTDVERLPRYVLWVCHHALAFRLQRRWSRPSQFTAPCAVSVTSLLRILCISGLFAMLSRVVAANWTEVQQQDM